jgi:hypothetical protein
MANFVSPFEKFGLPKESLPTLMTLAAMIEQVGETEDRWDEVAETAKIHGPDDLKDGSLLKDWYNIGNIKSVVSKVMSALNQYNFPNLSPRYGNAYLSHLGRTFSSTSTDVTTEDELDDLEDGSIHSGISHSSNGTRHCHNCGTTGQWHMPQDCPAASRVCHQCSRRATWQKLVLLAPILRSRYLSLPR